MCGPGRDSTKLDQPVNGRLGPSKRHFGCRDVPRIGIGSSYDFTAVLVKAAFLLGRFMEEILHRTSSGSLAWAGPSAFKLIVGVIYSWHCTELVSVTQCGSKQDNGS